MDLRKCKGELTAEVAEQANAKAHSQSRIVEEEDYNQRWCLQLYRVPETETKNVKVKVTETC